MTDSHFSDIQQARDAIVRAARREWRNDVRDFDSGQEATPELIQRYFEETGWSWFLEKHSDGTYTEQWKDHPWQKWCGLFIAFCGLRVGDYVGEQGTCVDVQLRDDVAREVLPSTKRLADPKRWVDGFPDFNRPGKMKLKAGDIITVGDGREGSHICLVRKDRQPQNTLVKTFEGNAEGRLGSGKQGEGVIKRERWFDNIKQTYRLQLDHFTGSALD